VELPYKTHRGIDTHTHPLALRQCSISTWLHIMCDRYTYVHMYSQKNANIRVIFPRVRDFKVSQDWQNISQAPFLQVSYNFQCWRLSKKYKYILCVNIYSFLFSIFFYPCTYVCTCICIPVPAKSMQIEHNLHAKCHQESDRVRACEWAREQALEKVENLISHAKKKTKKGPRRTKEVRLYNTGS